jgi:hypothetical protein
MNKSMYSLAMLICLILTSVLRSYAWGPSSDKPDYTTHIDITEYAVEESVLSQAKGDYLKQLGFSGLNTQLQWDVNNDGEISGTEQSKVIEWLKDIGAKLEDGNFREVNHFHNPINNTGLFDIWRSAVVWAQDSNAQATWNKPSDADLYPQIWDFPDTSSALKDWSWQTTRSYFYSAMTATAAKDREANFAKMFRGVGQQMHLLQDMSVPTHVRDDNHLIDRGVEKWAV